MKVPSCVLWGLTRKHSAFKVSRPGAKSRKTIFSQDPHNLTNLHNQSSQGFTKSGSYGLNVTRGISKTGKKFRKEYALTVTHASYHNNAKVSKSTNGAARNGFSVTQIKTGTEH